MNDSILSILDTIEHIQMVQAYLGQIVEELHARAIVHDRSKLQEPELTGYQGLSEAVKGLQYGTDEYRAAFAPFKETIQRHYAKNDHHPEHFQDNEVRRMHLLQVIEMLADWKAGSMRNSESLLPSLDVSFKRFGIDANSHLAWLIRNTVLHLDW